MKRITIDLPETAFSGIRKSPEEFVREMRIAAATQWYAQGRVSQDKGAEVAGLTSQVIVPATVIEEVSRGMDKDPTAAVAVEWAEQYREKDLTVPRASNAGI
mgnify:CR=1 FL=1